MKRSFHHLSCEGETLAATMDAGSKSTGLLIVSGGNEVRSGAHNGMAGLAAIFSDLGFPVLRFDRRGIGESSGDNSEFLTSAPEIMAASAFLREQMPPQSKIFAFGNCDAATALALFGEAADIDGYILANPWVIDPSEQPSENETTQTAASIRSRYWNRLKDPKSILDLFSGKIDLGKLFKGLSQATKKEDISNLSIELRDAFSKIQKPVHILLAKRDTTATVFAGAWQDSAFSSVRSMPNIDLRSLDTASHSFADAKSKSWLYDQIREMLESA